MSAVLDYYTSKFKTTTATDMPEEATFDEFSGRQLFCAKCREFRRTRNELVQREDKVAVLRVKCKTCGHYEDFVPCGETGLTPEGFDLWLERHVKGRVLKFLKGLPKVGK